MTSRGTATGLVVIVAGPLLVLAGLFAATGTATACAPTTPPTPVPTSALSGVSARYDADQLRNATTIVTVGLGQGIPNRGLVIAVATAIQESGLRNLGNLGAANDHDSLGLFQQRPSQGWGTPTQILDPVHAATAFYTHLRAVPDWQQLPLTEAAQAVQRSAYPTAYARWEPDATALVALTTGVAGGCTGGDAAPGATTPLPADFTLPAGTPDAVAIALTWALAQLGTPYSYGGDCTNPHGHDPAQQCDCSSLVQAAYHAAGITLPRTTSDQQHTGTLVAGLVDAKPGDLIFIPGSDGTMSHPGHVGLYLGHDLILHAPHTGDVVRLTPASAWASQIAVIRRVVG